MKFSWLKILVVLILLVSQIQLSKNVLAVDKDSSTMESTQQSKKNEESNEKEATAVPTIAPVIVGYEEYTNIRISGNNFTLKVTGEALSKEYCYELQTSMRVEKITGEVKYDNAKHALIFPENVSFNSDIALVSTTTEVPQTYEFNFGFEDAISTVITKVTVNTIEEKKDSENGSEDQKTVIGDDDETLSSDSSNEDSSISTSPYLNAEAPLELGPLTAAPKSINRDTMEDFDSKFNFTPKIFPGITKVGYNTNLAYQEVSPYELTKEQMDSIRLYGGFYVYYKRAGIYKGRYVDIKWTFKKSPSIGPNIRIKLHDTLNENYPSDRMFSITSVMYHSRANTELSFIDSETQQPMSISGYLSYGNVDNTEYYLFDDDKIKNYIYSYSDTGLNYVFGIPEDWSNLATSGVQGQAKGGNTIDASNTFTIMFEDQTTFPITYGYASSGVGYGVWLGSIDLNTIRTGYEPPILYGDEVGTNVEDNVLEYRVIQTNPSRGGGQTQIALPNEYKINIQIDNYDLLKTINPSDISVKRLDSNKTITNQFDISISNEGEITLNLKNIGNIINQKDNFPSHMEIKWKATTKEGAKLSKTYQNIDGQGYYIFPISGDLTYRESALENDVKLVSNKALAKIKTDDVPKPELDITYTNRTKEDGLNRENKKLYIGDILQYDIKLNNNEKALNNITLINSLPSSKLFRKIGEFYLTIDGKEMEIPQDFFDEKNNKLKFFLNEIPADSEVHLRYQLQVTGEAQGEALFNKASLMSDEETITTADVSTEQVSIIPIFNPEKLTEEIVPRIGTAGNQLGNLNLIYVPSFDFGEQKISNKDSEYNATTLTTKIGDEIPNFVQVHDTLQDKSGWKLSMTLTDFHDTEKKSTLLGAQLEINNAQYNNFEGLNRYFVGNIPQKVVFTSGGDANILVESTSKEDLQNTIIAFGNTGENTAVSSVTLKIPGNVKKEVAQYKADLDWQLQDVPE